MKKIVICCFLIFPFIVLAEDTTTLAFDLSGSVQFTKYLFTPYPSISFYWIVNKGIHEISSELMMLYLGDNESNEEFTSDLGLSYSFLLKLKYNFYIGPSLGFWFGNHYKNISQPDPNFPYYSNVHQIEVNDRFSFMGIKFGFIWGEKRCKFKFLNRVLFGFATDGFNSKNYISVIPSTGIGFIYAF